MKASAIRAYLYEALVFLAILAVCAGCSVFPKREPVEKIVTVPELYCPVQTVFPRPDPIDVPPPKFVVVKPGSEILRETGAMICMTAESYENLGRFTEAVIQYATETQAALDAWEAQAERTNGRND